MIVDLYYKVLEAGEIPIEGSLEYYRSESVERGGYIDQSSQVYISYLRNYFLAKHNATGEISRVTDEVLENRLEYSLILSDLKPEEDDTIDCYVSDDEITVERDDIEEEYNNVAVIPCGGAYTRDNYNGYPEKKIVGQAVEKARILTHYLAFELIKRNFETIYSFFSDDLKERKTLAAFEKDILKEERDWGKFIHFDKAATTEVFAGEKSWKSPLEKRFWPKGTDKKSRRATTRVQLSSFVSPNGVQLFKVYMHFSFIENDAGEYKIHNYRFED